MRQAATAVLLLVLVACAPVSGPPPESAVNTDEDPYLWLEEVDGQRAIRWVRARNQDTVRKWGERSSFKRLRERLLEVFDSEDRIPGVGKMGHYYYNFWRDTDNPRGLWRRTTLDEYRKREPAWQTILDLDALARREKENWVLGGFACRQPDYGRCLVSLSRGGADARVRREFDIEARSFVDDGFTLPESKGSVAWAGPDSIFVATDFGPGTMTESGYPRIVKLWHRGQDLAEAEVVFEGRPTDISVSASADLAQGFETELVWRQVGPEDADDGPTLLYGYGGFEIPLVPGYSAGVGLAWLERGGTYVVSNIRGGGEFGPRWHRAALRENRQRAYDDFIAVAEHLVERGVTETSRLGILGGSNGGLLMGNMLTMRPELFGAIVAQVPLLDMRRYHELLAGASWVAEYGDPDNPEDWTFLRQYSPYQNVRQDVAYPPLLITTSTRDDRVHPGHARKMVAKMRALGHDVTYYENIEGGHGGAADNAQSAFMWALVYEFLWRRLSGS